jgi:hypothetical protein
MRSRALYVNFGFGDVVATAAAHETGHFNRLIEREVSRLGGIKSLYSDSFFTREEFEAAYGMAACRPVKKCAMTPTHASALCTTSAYCALERQA